MSFVQVRNLKKNYGSVEALRGVDVTLRKGEQYALQGASGSGKSTFLYILAGLERPGEGEVVVDGRNISQLGDEDLARYRNLSVGLVFQFHFLLPTMSCRDNILLPARIGLQDLAVVGQRAERLAQELGVAGLLHKFPYQLSGGEQQRVNIVRALSLNPAILLCDEPTGSLDSENSKKVVALLKSTSEQYKTTLIVVTHDEKIAASFDHKLAIADGQLMGS